MADRRRSPALAAGALALVVLASACSGPTEPLKVGVREHASNVVLRGDDDPVVSDLGAPIPPLSLTLPPPGQSVGAVDTGFAKPPVVTTGPRLDGICRAGDPTDAPRLELSNRLDRLVAPTRDAPYTFFNDGSFEVGGANSRHGRFPETSTRSVIEGERVRASDVASVEPGSDFTWFEFDVKATLGDTVTTTTYVVLPEGGDDAKREVPIGFGVVHVPSERSAIPQFSGLARVNDGAPSGGLFIKRVVTETGDQRRTFSPETYLLLLPSPMQPGVTWDASGADPLSGEAMTFSGKLLPPARVDACGVPLSTWPVSIDGTFELGKQGGSAGANGTTQFRASYFFATAYGPLAVHDTLEMTATKPGGQTTHRENVASLIGEPRDPCSFASHDGGRFTCKPVAR